MVGADTRRCVDVAVPESIFPALQNPLLAATALDLGSALTTMATSLGDELRTIVALPEHVRPMAIVPLGHPARPLGPPGREPLRRPRSSRPVRPAVVSVVTRVA